MGHLSHAAAGAYTTHHAYCQRWCVLRPNCLCRRQQAASKQLALFSTCAQHTTGHMMCVCQRAPANTPTTGTRGDPLPAAGSFALRLVRNVRSCPVLVVKANSKGPYVRATSAALGGCWWLFPWHVVAAATTLAERLNMWCAVRLSNAAGQERMLHVVMACCKQSFAAVKSSSPGSLPSLYPTCHTPQASR